MRNLIKPLEIWKDVLGYEGHYVISIFGEINSLKYGKEKIIKKHLRNNYYSVTLTLKGKQKQRDVHQLMAETFLDHVPCGFKLVVNHINFDKKDNRLENLEIITTRENCNMKHLNSSSKHVGVYWGKNDKKWRATILINKKPIHLGSFKDEEEASEFYQNALKSFLNNEKIIVKKPVRSSKYKGVTFAKNLKKWVSCIYINGKRKHLGYFKTELEAHNTYQNELLKL